VTLNICFGILNANTSPFVCSTQDWNIPQKLQAGDVLGLEDTPEIVEVIQVLEQDISSLVAHSQHRLFLALHKSTDLVAPLDRGLRESHTVEPFNLVPLLLVRFAFELDLAEVLRLVVVTDLEVSVPATSNEQFGVSLVGHVAHFLGVLGEVLHRGAIDEVEGTDVATVVCEEDLPLAMVHDSTCYFVFAHVSKD